MNRVVKILIERDNMTYEEAESQVNEVQELLEEALSFGSYAEAEDILKDELGLEMDYIFDLI